MVHVPEFERGTARERELVLVTVVPALPTFRVGSADEPLFRFRENAVGLRELLVGPPQDERGVPTLRYELKGRDEQRYRFSPAGRAAVESFAAFIAEELDLLRGDAGLDLRRDPRVFEYRQLEQCLFPRDPLPARKRRRVGRYGR